MSQPDPEPYPGSATFAPAPVGSGPRPAAVTAAGGVMLVVAVVGGIAAMVGLLYHLTEVADVSVVLAAFLWDFEVQFTLLLLGLCAVVVVLAVLVWQGASAARLAAFATLGAAATATAAMAAGYLAVVAYGIDDLYEDAWKQDLIRMWAYLFATAILAAPIPLLNRPAATKWFRLRRSARPKPVATDPSLRPPVITLVRTALVVLAVLTVVAEGWRIGAIVSSQLIETADVPEHLITTLAHATIPLLILTAAIIEIGAGSRLGQTTAFMASGYACFRGVEQLSVLFDGSWLSDWQLFGRLFTTTAIGIIAAVTLILLLRAKVVDYLAYQSVDLEPDFELAAAAEDDDDDDPVPDRGT